MNIIITGTSLGLGFALARYYLERGDYVYGISRKKNAVLYKYNHFNFLPQDLSHFKEVEKNIPLFIKDLQKIDLVILNAGILNGIKDLKETSLDEIQKVMDVNVWANKVLIDILFRQTENIHNIVAISSGVSVNGSRGWNAYALSKATLNMLIRLYAKEYPATHFCALAPGLIDTHMQEYINSLPDDDRFPVVKRLKNAKGTDQMPVPSRAAKIIAKALTRIDSYKSGSYVDVRDL